MAEAIPHRRRRQWEAARERRRVVVVERGVMGGAGSGVGWDAAADPFSPRVRGMGGRIDGLRGLNRGEGPKGWWAPVAASGPWHSPGGAVEEIRRLGGIRRGGRGFRQRLLQTLHLGTEGFDGFPQLPDEAHQILHPLRVRVGWFHRWNRRILDPPPFFSSRMLGADRRMAGSRTLTSWAATAVIPPLK